MSVSLVKIIPLPVAIREALAKNNLRALSLAIMLSS